VFNILKDIYKICIGLLYRGVYNLPVTNLSSKLKLRMLKKQKFTDKKSTNYLINSGLVVKGNVTMGDGLSINQNVLILSSYDVPIKIGNYVLIGPNVVIRNANHGFKDLDTPMRFQKKTAKEIIIEDDVWIAANCVIVAGAIIRKGSIVAAGSVVTKGEYPENSIIGGVPAKIIGARS